LAEQGNSKAQYHLGLCYLLGYGVDKNVEEAVKWLEKAAKEEYADAQEELDDITNNQSLSSYDNNR
jgi:TPR repeat protein